MILLKLIICILIFIVLPILIGSTLFDVLKIDRSVKGCLIIGMMTMWAICQIVSIPIILLKQSFLYVVIALSLLYLLIVLVGIKKKSFSYIYYGSIKRDMKSLLSDKRDMLGIIIVILSLAVILFFSIYFQHTDADDSRMGVNIVDILRTHRMFITNPGTGDILGTWEGEVSRDVISPWSVFVAYCSYLTHIHPTIVNHTIIPLFLYIYIYIVYWMISGEIIEKGFVYRGIFVVFITLINIYGYASTYVAETRVMVRLWQGKTVVSGLCIPLLIYLFLIIYKNGVDKSMVVILLIVETAMCMLSGMGILIGAIMVGSYGLIYAIIKKDWKLCLKMWSTAIPCCVFYGLSILL